MSTSTRTSATPTPARRPRRSWRASVASPCSRYPRQPASEAPTHTTLAQKQGTIGEGGSGVLGGGGGSGGCWRGEWGKLVGGSGKMAGHKLGKINTAIRIGCGIQNDEAYEV
jgi:hypothetical protein